MQTTNGPYKVNGSEVKYQNHWLTVREDAVIHPNGQPGIFGVIEYGRGVSVLPMDAEGNVYLIDEYEYAIRSQSLETANGGIEEGETELAAAQRELLEETGISATDWTPLGMVNPFTAVVHSPAYLFLARGLTFAEARPEATENIKVLKLKFTEAVSMVMESKITHGPSCVTILKAEKFLEAK